MTPCFPDYHPTMYEYINYYSRCDDILFCYGPEVLEASDTGGREALQGWVYYSKYVIPTKPVHALMIEKGPVAYAL